MSPLAELVRGRRLALRLTQREAAKRAGVSLATWQNVERPTSRPDGFQELTLACVAHGLGLDADAVFTVAGRSAPATVGGGSDGAARRGSVTEDIGALFTELEQVLYLLAETSMESAAFVCGQAADTAGFLLNVHAATR